MAINYKNVKKVKIKSSWCSDEEILDRLLYQFKTSDDDLSHIEFVMDNSYDIIIFNNYVNETPKINSKSYIFFHEPTWTGTHQKNFKSFDDITIFGFDKKFYEPNFNVIELPSHTFYGGRGPWVDSKNDWNYNNVINNENVKTKNISSVVTKLNSDSYDEEGSTYKIRHDLTDFLIKNLNFVDFYGGWGDSNNCKGSNLKIDAVKNYKFCIAIENQFTKNWITEKFYDSILNNTIPIYYGCTNIKEIFPENGYILIEDIHDFESVLSQIQEIEKNADKIYNELMPNLLKIKERYFSEFNPLKLINNLCK
jgi:hypothetical protein